MYQDLARWFAIAVPVGVVAGLGAALFYYLITLVSGIFLGQIAGVTLPIEGTTNPADLRWASSFPQVLIVPVIMALGGLFVGAITWRIAPEVAGHGTDAAIRAFHRNAGKVRARVPILKTIASAVTLGTGGSGGREGPVAQIGGVFGSLWADLVGLGDHDRRVALATGLGAGIGAIFRAPLGGAIYSAEILYTGDFEPDVFVPAIIASVVAYSIYSLIFQFHALFAAPASIGLYQFDPSRLPFYAILGIVCGAAGLAFTFLYRRTEAWVNSWRGPTLYKPAVGAGIAGLLFAVAYFAFPQQAHFAALSSLSIGYGFVQAAMLGMLGSGTFTMTVILILLVAVFLRMVMTALVVGGGGAAGLFGTSVVVGALLGTAVGGTFHTLFPSQVPAPVVAVFAIVGMMSFFGGISKAPLGVLIMVVEMAGSYSVLPAAMLSIFIAYVVTGRVHIYSEQLPSRIQSPAHLEEYRAYFMTETPVAQIASQESQSVPPTTTAREAIDLAVTHGRAVLSVEADASWLGAVRLSDLLAVPPDRREATLVADLLRPVDLLISGDTCARDALALMEQQGTTVGAVVSTDGPVRIVGLVTRRGIRSPDLGSARRPA